MVRTVEVCSTVTGERLAVLPATSCTWALRMNGQIGTGDAAFHTKAAEFDRFSSAQWSNFIRPRARTIVVREDGRPFYAGIITGKPTHNPITGELKIPHAEIGELVKGRLWFDPATYDKKAKRTLTDLSRQGVLVELTRIMMGGGYPAPVAGPVSDRIPIFIPSAIPGTRDVEAFQHEFATLWESITAIPDEVNGEDFVFAPGYGAQGLQWVMHVGNPQLNRSSHEWHVNAEQSPLTDATVTWDEVQRYTSLAALGKGTGSEMIVGTTSATPAAGSPVTPAVHGVIPAKDVEKQSQIDAIAAGAIRSSQWSPQLWTIKARADAVLMPMLGEPSDGIRPGSRLRLRWTADKILGTGYADRYITGVSGDLGDEVTLEGQPL